MDEKLNKAIEILAGKIIQTVKSDDALRYTQAALNLAHVMGVMEIRTTEVKASGKTKGASAT